jgi:HSP20 family molecular chaperone IbpA
MHKISSTVQFAKRRLAITRDHETHWAPNTDVYVTDSGLVIKVELAGMQRENLELTVEGTTCASAASGPTAAAPPNANSWSWKSTTAL